MIHSGASVIELRGVSRTEGAPGSDGTGAALHAITLAIAPGTMTVLRGEPDSGTRELLRVLGLIDAPQSGNVLVEGESTAGWPEERRAEYRARRLGFLFAARFLLPAMSAIENVAMPILKFSGASVEEAGQRARGLLAFVGMSGRAQILAGDLDPLEQYRVAIARALANGPGVLLVEELDAGLAGEALAEIGALLRQVAEERGVAVVVTVSARFLPAPGDRLLEMAAGRLGGEAALAGTPLN